MMTGPGDEKAAGTSSRGHLRAAHADREQVIDTLKAAFIQGRLTKDELDLRESQTFASRTYGELAAVTADLPAGLTAGFCGCPPATRLAGSTTRADGPGWTRRPFTRSTVARGQGTHCHRGSPVTTWISSQTPK